MRGSVHLLVVDIDNPLMDKRFQISQSDPCHVGGVVVTTMHNVRESGAGDTVAKTAPRPLCSGVAAWGRTEAQY